MRQPLSAVAVLSAALLVLAGPGSASPAPKTEEVRLPSAASVLQKAKKELDKTKSFDVSLSVTGGLSTTEDHAVSTVTVNRHYGGQIFTAGDERVLHEKALKVFKTPKSGKGVIKESGNWIRLLSSQSGVEMDRLFAFPEKVLADALKYANTAQWLPDTGDEDEEEADEEDSDDDEAKQASGTGKTVVKSSGDAEEAKVAAARARPRTIRVEAPPKQALEIFNLQVNNSGCMREG